MENEVMNAVLNEILAEQKDATGQLEDIEKNLAAIAERLGIMEEKLDSQKIMAATADTASVQSLVAKGLDDIKKVMAGQPREVVHEKHFLFFPEHNAREYYGTLLRWVLYIIIATYGYLLVKYMVERWG